MDGASPVLLSSCGEKERQWHIASNFAKLIGLPVGSAGAIAEVEEVALRAEMQEMQRLRVDVHSADLEKSSSQKRMASLHFAVRQDPSLLSRQMELHTESERQHFWTSIDESIKKRDFSSFSFTEADYDIYWRGECARRFHSVVAQRERLVKLECQHEARLQRFIDDCTNKLSIFGWNALPVSPSIEPRVDALAMEGPDKIWVAAEVRQPLTSAGFARDFVLLVDLSGSMCDAMDLLKDCLRDIVSRARNDDRVCVIGFASTSQLLCDWTTMADQEARSSVRHAVDNMAAHGGTYLVPAFAMVQEQFSRLQPFPAPAAVPEASTLELMPCLRKNSLSSQTPVLLPPAPLRMPVVVLLSDGDPEEPAEAVYTSACSALEAAPGSKASLLSLSLGDGSNPALMALTAQCGGGPSLYIADNSQLPEQLGRMWGYLCTLVQPRDLFLVLTPVGDGQIIQVERPLGGSVELRSAGGQQSVIMSCGSAAAGSVQRFVSQLQLPTWLSRGVIDEHALHAPLLQMTWVWRQGLDGTVEMTTSELRVVQVPSLLMEARLGLPVRVTIDTEWSAGLDCERFLGALAQALHLPANRLKVDKLSPGSIIVDLQITDVTPAEFDVIKAACKAPTDQLTEACAAVSASGFPVKAFSLPGGSTFQRVLQWQLAQALEDAAQKQRVEGLRQVRDLASSHLARQLDPEGKAASVAADAAAASHQVIHQALSPPRGANHTLLQQAYAHCQQLCPELEPGAISVADYELQAMRESAGVFVASAAQRADPPYLPPAAIVELAAPEDSLAEGVLSVRLRATGKGAIAVNAFKVEWRTMTGFEGSAGHDGQAMLADSTVNYSESGMLMEHSTEQTLTEDVPAAVGDVLSGVLHNFQGLPAGMFVQLRAAAYTADGELGPWSASIVGAASVAPAPVPAMDAATLEPLMTISAPVPAPVLDSAVAKPDSIEAASHAREERASPKSRKSQLAARRQSSRCSTSTAIDGLEIQIAKAEVDIHRFSLLWYVKGDVQPEPGKRWVVTITPITRGGPVRFEVDEPTVEVDSLMPSKGYRFKIEAAPERPQACSFGCVTNSSIARGVTYRPTEGIVLIPPFNEVLLKNYSADPMLDQISAGVFLSSLGPDA